MVAYAWTKPHNETVEKVQFGHFHGKATLENSGDIAWGHSILTALRDHICNTGEQKSIQWVLPKVLETLAKLTSCTPIPPSQGR